MAARLGATRSRSAARLPISSGCWRTSSDSVRVSFDAEALERAIRAPDIEAHGLREKMAVLAVVVATTGAAAGSAQAMPSLGGQGGVSGGATVTSTRDMPTDSLSASVASTEGAAGHPGKPERCRSSERSHEEARLAEQARLDLRHDEVLPSVPPRRAASGDRHRPRLAVRFGPGIPGACSRPRRSWRDDLRL